MFENTEIAFRTKSNSELNNAKRIFTMVANPWLVKTGKILLMIALKLHIPIKWAVKPTVFKQFCGGESMEECDKTINELSLWGVKSILDYSAEGLETEESFEDTFRKIISIIDKAKTSSAIPYAVFKPTGIARFALLQKINEGKTLSDQEKEEFKRVQYRFSKLCEHAASKDVPLMIDAEESWIQDAVDELVEKEMAKYNKNKPLIYNTVQLYRKDRLKYLMDYSEKAWKNKIYPGFKLVRGAYLEKERERAAKFDYPSPVHDTKDNTDNDFNMAVKFCLDNANKMASCVGTHNEDSVNFAVLYMKDEGILPGHENIWFSQLLGMSDNISFNLAERGFNVCKYVPYGPVRLVMPYLVRRAEENTSVAGQTSKELQMIKTELRRRKQLK